MTARGPARVVVLGTGAIGQVVHVPILAEHPNADLLAVGDLDVPKARMVAERFGVPEVVAPAEAIVRDDVEGVVICTPNALHEEMAIAALRAGKHVFVERPVAITAAGAERVIDAADEAGRCLVVGLPHRFRPEVAALRSFVAGGDLGGIYAVRGSWLTRQVPLMRPTWRQKREEAGGGALMDLGVPALDLCLSLVGYPTMKRISCSLSRGDHPVEEAATLMAESEDGMALTLEVSNRYFAGEDRFYARVMGREGSGSLPPLEVYKQLGGRPLEVTPRQPRPRGGENPYTNAYRRQLDHFVRAIVGEVEAPLPREQIVLMGLLEAAYRAAESGREERL